MLMLASATQKEVESVSDNIEQLSKDVSKLSQIGSDLIDKAVAFGIDIIIAVIIFVIGKFFCFEPDVFIIINPLRSALVLNV